MLAKVQLFSGPVSLASRLFPPLLPSPLGGGGGGGYRFSIQVFLGGRGRRRRRAFWMMMPSFLRGVSLPPHSSLPQIQQFFLLPYKVYRITKEKRKYYFYLPLCFFVPTLSSQFLKEIHGGKKGKSGQTSFFTPKPPTDRPTVFLPPPPFLTETSS